MVVTAEVHRHLHNQPVVMSSSMLQNITTSSGNQNSPRESSPIISCVGADKQQDNGSNRADVDTSLTKEEAKLQRSKKRRKLFQLISVL